VTDATVPVPVALLKRLKGERELRFIDNQGALYSVRDDDMAGLLALIPAEPKVGDLVNEDNVRDLPVGTVLRDKVGDIWFVAGDKRLRYINPRKTDPAVSGIDDPAFSYYEPVVVSLPRD
jgi:hypothetical protein